MRPSQISSSEAADRGTVALARPVRPSDGAPPPQPAVRLLDRICVGCIRPTTPAATQHPRVDYSYRTEQAYVYWARRFILFHGKRHPHELDARKVGARLLRSKKKNKNQYPLKSDRRRPRAAAALCRRVLRVDERD